MKSSGWENALCEKLKISNNSGNSKYYDEAELKKNRKRDVVELIYKKNGKVIWSKYCDGLSWYGKWQSEHWNPVDVFFESNCHTADLECWEN